MKKKLKKRKKMLLGMLIGVSFVIVVVVAVILAPGKKEESTFKNDNYYISGEIKEATGTKEYSNETLQSKHCLDDICISEAKFYYLDNQGRVDYVIENVGSTKKSGLYKMVFGEDKLIISFKNLEPGKTHKSTAQYLDKTISDMNDYSLEYLTEEEKNSVVSN